MDFSLLNNNLFVLNIHFEWINNYSFKTVLFISIGAILGALSRYYLTVYFSRHSQVFPFGTLIINISGCFFMGIIAFLSQELIVSIPFQLLFVTGFLGSYTTFSTYILESSNLWRNNKKKHSILYWIGSVILGIIALELGINLTKVVLIIIQ
ncbi:fluoride efflux transporter CrcB [Geminocystis sp. NIES-3709]|uniref:fluoride efflux transporter CrcB n=1 Tax=Geminocystis sp. NIES-3709 TaxID=1617448 RepID=UPI0005FC91D3|nr:fluoride efflux transporter CrcB [Geminocystis sp. NIES-3709]BAQ64893.1 CrcB protein [Geminocystis sp. NIES-3709]